MKIFRHWYKSNPGSLWVKESFLRNRLDKIDLHKIYSRSHIDYLLFKKLQMTFRLKRGNRRQHKDMQKSKNGINTKKNKNKTKRSCAVKPSTYDRWFSSRLQRKHFCTSTTRPEETTLQTFKKLCVVSIQLHKQHSVYSSWWVCISTFKEDNRSSTR